MDTYEKIKQNIASLLKEAPSFCLERLPRAFQDYQRLSPNLILSIRSLTVSSEVSKTHNRDYRNAILQLVSIEAAAGASVRRCRSWFCCLAALSAWIPPNSVQAVNITEAATWTALAGKFEANLFADWPDTPCIEATSSRTVYRLLTGKTIDFALERNLFDNSLWEDLCFTIESKETNLAKNSFSLIADWWLSEYEDSETLAYDPLNFSTFEPEPNAALLISLVRDRMPINFDKDVYKKFYYIALMLSEES